MSLDLPAARLIAFADVLRGAGFGASTDQAISFLQAVRALGPRDLNDLRHAGRAVFGPRPDRFAEFDALFDQHFLGRAHIVQGWDDDDDAAPPQGDPLSEDTPPDAELSDDPGQTASATRIETERNLLSPLSDAQTLKRFAKLAPRRMPERLSRRRRPGGSGNIPDRLRTFRAACRSDGEILSLPKLQRRRHLRPILLLIDISGSMKDHTEDALRFAHRLVRLPTRVEVFTLGTNYTRLTNALRRRSEAQALAEIAGTVRDFDGGTRLGETLGQLLAVPRYAGFARGAVVCTLSDGLEIGGSDHLHAATRRLYGLAFAHVWLTPLADGPEFTPQTEALVSIAHLVDAFGSARTIQHICAHLLGEAPRPEVSYP